MRQNRIQFYHLGLSLKITLVLACLLACVQTATADVANVTLTVTPSDSKKYNAGQVINLSATWAADTPPCAATFFGGNPQGPIGTTNSSSKTGPATFNVSAATVGKVGVDGTSGGFKVEVLETSVANAVSNSGSAGSVNLDFKSPDLTITINKPSDKKIAPGGTLEFIVSSDEKLQAAPTVTITGVSGSLAAASTVGNVYFYTWTAPAGTADGGKTITATAKDDSQPPESANEGTKTETFTVDAVGPSVPTITSSDPQSPTSHKTFTVKGKRDADTTAVYGVQTGTTASKAATLSGAEDWEISWTVTDDGEKKYTVVGIDALGNKSVSSAEFVVKVDTTGPGAAAMGGKGTPVLVDPLNRVPTKLATINITGSGTADPLFGTPVAVNSNPVTVKLFKLDGTTVSTTTANNDGTFTFSSVPLAVGDNQFYCQAEDSAIGSPGNPSNNSAIITITRDALAGGLSQVVIAAVNFASQPIPLPATTYIGPGNYSIQITFNEPMATDTNPTISYTTQNGGSVANNTGNWASPTVFVGSINIPAGQGATMDGEASVTISKAKDVAGNEMTAQTYGTTAAGQGALHIDTSAPKTSLASQSSTLYIGSGTTSVTINGSATDDIIAGVANSGVGYVEVIWQDFDATGPISSSSVPIFSAQPVTWNFNWNISSIADGKYKLWARSADRAVPTANLEAINSGYFRTVIIDKGIPTITRIAFDDMTVDINPPSPNVISSDVSKLTATVADAASGGGIDFSRISTQTFVLKDPNGAVVDGNFTNNGANTITFTFPTQTLSGTYTVDLTIFDLSGNSVTASPSRVFVIDKDPPSTVSFEPGNGVTVNFTNPAIAADEVWAYITDTPPINYASTSSKMEVLYNGILAGPAWAGNSSDSALVWPLYGAAQTASDQSVDGRYDVFVTPVDSLGNTGPVQKSNFWLDSQPPAMTLTDPASGSWFGLGGKALSAKFSDAPADLVKYENAKVASDATWQNGKGSGVNLAASTINAGVDATTSFSGSAVGTDTLTVNFPNLAIGNGTPISTLPGVSSISMSATVPDNVNNLRPNVKNASYTLLYDYLRPSFVFRKPKAGKKYCKPQIFMEGSVYDNGTAIDSLQVTRAEVSADKATWAPVNASITLPVASTTWSVTADISSLIDGNASLYGRCYDRAENLSHPTDPRDATGAPTEVSIVIDRTPPVPPTLVLPLPDSILNSRGVLFRWGKVTGATRYLAQVSDNQGFTNVLNNMATTTATDLIGAVTFANEMSFSAPKDGTYYWRVACLEDCEDGYNISSFSTTWKYTVDTVKPKVLEVQPTPSTGNKISTGMVTFTLRFSEKMDITKPPTVSLTSAGGQFMLVEQVTYRENTWTGTTVIPKDSSALYDGNAVISISGAKDVAGNDMEVDSTHMVIINTGPAFETKIFSNPAHEYEIVIVTRSTEALQAAPTCSVTQGGGRIPVTMNFLKEKYYAGSYRIDPTTAGKAYIDLSGTDLYGMVGHGSVEFSVAAINPSVRTFLTSPDRTSTVDIPSGSMAKATALYIIPKAFQETTVAKAPSARVAVYSNGALVNPVVQANPELKEVLILDELGPISAKLAKKIWYKTSVKGLKTDVPLTKVHLYRQSGNGWIFNGGALKNEILTAQIDGFGKFALMADVKAPAMVRISPSDRERLEDPMPLFEGTISDKGSGLWPESLKITIDGVEQTGVVVDSTGNFSYQVKKPLAKGLHQVEVSVSDRAGNNLKKAFSVVAPGPFAIDELMAYPNPTRGEAVWITYNLQQKADEIKLKIMNTAGEKVAEFDTSDFTALASGKIRWDLTNDSGRKVGNGVYFFKMEATKNGNKTKATRKLAVLR